MQNSIELKLVANQRLGEVYDRSISLINNKQTQKRIIDLYKEIQTTPTDKKKNDFLFSWIEAEISKIENDENFGSKRNLQLLNALKKLKKQCEVYAGAGLIYDDNFSLEDRKNQVAFDKILQALKKYRPSEADIAIAAKEEEDLKNKAIASQEKQARENRDKALLVFQTDKQELEKLVNNLDKEIQKIQEVEFGAAYKGEKVGNDLSATLMTCSSAINNATTLNELETQRVKLNKLNETIKLEKENIKVRLSESIAELKTVAQGHIDTAKNQIKQAKEGLDALKETLAKPIADYPHNKKFAQFITMIDSMKRRLDNDYAKVAESKDVELPNLNAAKEYVEGCKESIESASLIEEEYYGLKRSVEAQISAELKNEKEIIDLIAQANTHIKAGEAEIEAAKKVYSSFKVDITKQCSDYPDNNKFKEIFEKWKIAVAQLDTFSKANAVDPKKFDLTSLEGANSYLTNCKKFEESAKNKKVDVDSNKESMSKEVVAELANEQKELEDIKNSWSEFEAQLLAQKDRIAVDVAAFKENVKSYADVFPGVKILPGILLSVDVNDEISAFEASITGLSEKHSGNLATVGSQNKKGFEDRIKFTRKAIEELKSAEENFSTLKDDFENNIASVIEVQNNKVEVEITRIKDEIEAWTAVLNPDEKGGSITDVFKALIAKVMNTEEEKASGVLKALITQQIKVLNDDYVLKYEKTKIDKTMSLVDMKSQITAFSELVEDKENKKTNSIRENLQLKVNVYAKKEDYPERDEKNFYDFKELKSVREAIENFGKDKTTLFGKDKATPKELVSNAMNLFSRLKTIDAKQMEFVKDWERKKVAAVGAIISFNTQYALTKKALDKVKAQYDLEGKLMTREDKEAIATKIAELSNELVKKQQAGKEAERVLNEIEVNGHTDVDPSVNTLDKLEKEMTDLRMDKLGKELPAQMKEATAEARAHVAEVIAGFTALLQAQVDRMKDKINGRPKANEIENVIRHLKDDKILDGLLMCLEEEDTIWVSNGNVTEIGKGQLLNYLLRADIGLEDNKTLIKILDWRRTNFFFNLGDITSRTAVNKYIEEAEKGQKEAGFAPTAERGEIVLAAKVNPNPVDPVEENEFDAVFN